jgi:hypothetical protein
MIRTMEEVERETILAAIKETGSAIETARLLKMGKTTVFRKLKKWGVPVPGTNGLRKKKIPAPVLPSKQYLMLPRTPQELKAAQFRCPGCQCPVLLPNGNGNHK